AGLWEVLGDPVAGLDAMGRLLGLRGRVLPMSTVPLQIVAEVVGLDPYDLERSTTVRGQVAVATTTGRVTRVGLEPERPPAPREAVAAIQAADWVVLGPGSWYTSVIPHLLVPELIEALAASPARRVLTLNLAAQDGETAGFDPHTHLEVLTAHAPWLRLDVVLADADRTGPPEKHRELVGACSRLGARLVRVPLAVGDGTPRHDPTRLAAAYADLLATPVQPAHDAVGGSGPWR
ncbi:MAG: gluconeogenesis factor YvcK family protein, partial [Actinomycetes bacterium]